MSKKPYRINGKDVVVKADSVLYDGISGTDNVEGALDYLKENGGGGGLQPSDIVNDLSTGGTDKALSAEMGKELNEAIDDKLSEVIVNSLDPGDVAVIDDVTTGGSTNVLSAEQGKVLKNTKQPRMEIFVAANNAPSWQKAGADYVCDGVNDEVEIQAAIDKIANTGGRIRLSAGTFWIDSWQHTRHNYDNAYGKCAIAIPNNTNCEYIIEGSSQPLIYSSTSARGTTIRVSDTLYDNTPSTEYCTIVGSSWDAYPQSGARGSLFMYHIRFALPWNQKPIMCVDTFLISKVAMQYISCAAFSSLYNSGWTPISEEPCPIPAVGCVGIRSVGGGNWGTVADYKNILVQGFHQGFMFAGEHIIAVNLSAMYCYYPYTFGNWNYTGISGHPMTFINCNEEHCCCGPYFASGGQQVDMLQYNGEVIPSRTPGAARIKNATISSASGVSFYGRIEYTMMVDTYVNKKDYSFWEDGHGHSFISKNMTHTPAASTNEIKSWSPDYMEMVYNTNMNMMLVCTDTSTKEWRDMSGTVRVTGS